MYNFKYLTSFIAFHFKSFAAGQKIEIKKTQPLIKIKIKNKKLARELENACIQKKSPLTYKEFLNISQFGKNGYYKNHKPHGESYSYTRWGKPIVELCKKNNLHQIVEFGFGDGKLAIEIIKNAKKENYPLFWSGIEVNSDKFEELKSQFAKENIENKFYKLTTDIKNFNFKKPCLYLFSYSLDSLSPDVFINATNKKAPPNAILGIDIKNGYAEEVILKVAIKKNLIQDFFLFPNQKIFVPTSAFEILKKTSYKMPNNSLIVILDEFEPIPFSKDTSTICAPKDLERYDPNRSIKNTKTLLQQAGENLLYYPFFLQSYKDLLVSLKFKNILATNEHLGALQILENNLKELKEQYKCYVILGKLEKN